MKNTIKIIALAAIAALFSACTSTTYTDPSGAKFSRVSFLNTQQAQKVEVHAGDKSLVIDGYTNQQAEVAGAVAGAVAKALAPVK